MATGRSKTERALGNCWAKLMSNVGHWVQKLPASSLAGLPDWILVTAEVGIVLVEAKLLQSRGNAFVPSQCTKAQRFFLEAVSRHGGEAYVLVLGPESWYLHRVKGKVEFLAREVYDRFARSYDLEF